MAKYMLMSGIKVSTGYQQERFGRLTSVGAAFRLLGKTLVVCECECGEVTLKALGELKKGTTKSCGCLLRETNKTKKTKHGGYVGYKESPEMNTWRSMIKRCYSSTNDNFGRYGGRGIGVCESWRGSNGFACFLEDMGCRPSASHTLDRINNDGDYGPENCRWATAKQQANNKSNLRFIEHDGRRLTVTEWSTILGIRVTTILERLKRGLSGSDALTKPIAKKASQC